MPEIRRRVESKHGLGRLDAPWRSCIAQAHGKLPTTAPTYGKDSGSVDLDSWSRKCQRRQSLTSPFEGIAAVGHRTFEEGSLGKKAIVSADWKETSLKQNPDVLHRDVFATKEEVTTTVYKQC